MSALRSKLRGKVHLLDPKGKRLTKCGWSLGNLVEDGENGNPAIFDREGSHILVKLEGMDGVTCHPCRWGRNNRPVPKY